MTRFCFPKRNSCLLSKLFSCISYYCHAGGILGLSHPPFWVRLPSLATVISARLHPSSLDWTEPCQQSVTGCRGGGSRRRGSQGGSSSAENQSGRRQSSSAQSGHFAKNNKATQNDAASEDSKAYWEASHTPKLHLLRAVPTYTFLP